MASPELHAEGETFTLRTACQTDLEAIAGLWLVMMDDHCRFDARFAVSAASQDFFLINMRSLLHSFDHCIVVAEAGTGEIAAYGLGSIVDNPAMYILPRYGFLVEMMVDPRWRRRGLGTALWQRLVLWFRSHGIQTVQLNVSVSNETGQAFWRSLGFGPFVNVLWTDLETGGDLAS
jgi:GNAT superfamily N-acetyltransferase